ncbi:MAG: hypothetical protein ACRDD1_00980, partial [Planctomycetia bacterium]
PRRVIVDNVKAMEKLVDRIENDQDDVSPRKAGVPQNVHKETKRQIERLDDVVDKLKDAAEDLRDGGYGRGPAVVPSFAPGGAFAPPPVDGAPYYGPPGVSRSPVRPGPNYAPPPSRPAVRPPLLPVEPEQPYDDLPPGQPPVGAPFEGGPDGASFQPPPPAGGVVPATGDAYRGYVSPAGAVVVEKRPRKPLVLPGPLYWTPLGRYIPQVRVDGDEVKVKAGRFKIEIND